MTPEEAGRARARPGCTCTREVAAKQHARRPCTAGAGAVAGRPRGDCISGDRQDCRRLRGPGDQCARRGHRAAGGGIGRGWRRLTCQSERGALAVRGKRTHVDAWMSCARWTEHSRPGGCCRVRLGEAPWPLPFARSRASVALVCTSSTHDWVTSATSRRPAARTRHVGCGSRKRVGLSDCQTQELRAWAVRRCRSEGPRRHQAARAPLRPQTPPRPPANARRPYNDTHARIRRPCCDAPNP